MPRNWHPNTFRRRKVIPDKRHRWPVSSNGTAFGFVELQEDTFVALDFNGALIGKFNSLTDARQAIDTATMKVDSAAGVVIF
jgi:hypothetical protein